MYYLSFIKQAVKGIIIFLMAFGCNRAVQNLNHSKTNHPQTEIKLPDPVYKGNISVEEALLERRSVRGYKNESLDLKEIAQLLWAAQGITSPLSGGRTAPSAGALYPLQLYLVSSKINELTQGVFHYDPTGHKLILHEEADILNGLTAASSGQGAINRSAAIIVIAANYNRTIKKYSTRGIRFVQMEAGHAAQNICLQATALNIGTVTIGAFKDSLVKQLLKLPQDEEPLYLMPIGKKR